MVNVKTKEEKRWQCSAAAQQKRQKADAQKARRERAQCSACVRVQAVRTQTRRDELQQQRNENRQRLTNRCHVVT